MRYCSVFVVERDRASVRPLVKWKHVACQCGVEVRPSRLDAVRLFTHRKSLLLDFVKLAAMHRDSHAL